MRWFRATLPGTAFFVHAFGAVRETEACVRAADALRRQAGIDATAMALETETALARLRREHALSRARLQELLGGVAP
jgi:hypothetical protein